MQFLGSGTSSEEDTSIITKPVIQNVKQPPKKEDSKEKNAKSPKKQEINNDDEHDESPKKLKKPVVLQAANDEEESSPNKKNKGKKADEKEPLKEQKGKSIKNQGDDDESPKKRGKAVEHHDSDEDISPSNKKKKNKNEEVKEVPKQQKKQMDEEIESPINKKKSKEKSPPANKKQKESSDKEGSAEVDSDKLSSGENFSEPIPPENPIDKKKGGAKPQKEDSPKAGKAKPKLVEEVKKEKKVKNKQEDQESDEVVPEPKQKLKKGKRNEAHEEVPVIKSEDEGNQANEKLKQSVPDKSANKKQKDQPQKKKGRAHKDSEEEGNKKEHKDDSEEERSRDRKKKRAKAEEKEGKKKQDIEEEDVKGKGKLAKADEAKGKKKRHNKGSDEDQEKEEEPLRKSNMKEGKKAGKHKEGSDEDAEPTPSPKKKNAKPSKVSDDEGESAQTPPKEKKKGKKADIVKSKSGGKKAQVPGSDEDMPFEEAQDSKSKKSGNKDNQPESIKKIVLNKGEDGKKGELPVGYNSISVNQKGKVQKVENKKHRNEEEEEEEEKKDDNKKAKNKHEPALEKKSSKRSDKNHHKHDDDEDPGDISEGDEILKTKETTMYIKVPKEVLKSKELAVEEMQSSLDVISAFAENEKVIKSFAPYYHDNFKWAFKTINDSNTNYRAVMFHLIRENILGNRHARTIFRDIIKQKGIWVMKTNDEDLKEGLNAKLQNFELKSMTPAEKLNTLEKYMSSPEFHAGLVVLLKSAIIEFYKPDKIDKADVNPMISSQILEKKFADFNESSLEFSYLALFLTKCLKLSYSACDLNDHAGLNIARITTVPDGLSPVMIIKVVTRPSAGKKGMPREESFIVVNNDPRGESIEEQAYKQHKRLVRSMDACMNAVKGALGGSPNKEEQQNASNLDLHKITKLEIISKMDELLNNAYSTLTDILNNFNPGQTVNEGLADNFQEQQRIFKKVKDNGHPPSELALYQLDCVMTRLDDLKRSKEKPKKRNSIQKHSIDPEPKKKRHSKPSKEDSSEPESRKKGHQHSREESPKAEPRRKHKKNRKSASPEDQKERKSFAYDKKDSRKEGIKHKRESEDATLIFCQKCKKAPKRQVTLLCGHSFCKSCIETDILERTNSNVVNIDFNEREGELQLKCPVGNCVIQIDESSFTNIFSEKKIQSKIKAARAKKMSASRIPVNVVIDRCLLCKEISTKELIEIHENHVYCQTCFKANYEIRKHAGMNLKNKCLVNWCEEVLDPAITKKVEEGKLPIRVLRINLVNIHCTNCKSDGVSIDQRPFSNCANAPHDVCNNCFKELLERQNKERRDTALCPSCFVDGKFEEGQEFLAKVQSIMSKNK